jgi:hypothetical protein
MKLLLKQPSVSLSFAEYKGPDTFGEGLIRAYLYEIFWLLLRRKLKKKKTPLLRYQLQTSPW